MSGAKDIDEDSLSLFTILEPKIGGCIVIVYVVCGGIGFVKELCVFYGLQLIKFQNNVFIVKHLNI